MFEADLTVEVVEGKYDNVTSIQRDIAVLMDGMEMTLANQSLLTGSPPREKSRVLRRNSSPGPRVVVAASAGLEAMMKSIDGITEAAEKRTLGRGTPITDVSDEQVVAAEVASPRRVIAWRQGGFTGFDASALLNYVPQHVW